MATNFDLVGTTGGLVSVVETEKVCRFCGRSFEYRKKWLNNWAEVKYCSDSCRDAFKRTGQSKVLEIQNEIMKLLETRTAEKTICPSEVLPANEKQNKSRMEFVRQAARHLVHQGKVEITQGGKVVDPDEFRGPIRIRKKRI